ncbi:MAG: trehalose-phosphatase [Thaumarchaeota archaeon]|nr:trehalose-phosphatase [Nitrososphaerota archaeon]
METSIAKAPFIELFLDFDGTIAPIESTPDRVLLPAGVRKILISLHKTGKCRVGIISGRALSDILQMVNLKGFYYAGNHGFEIAGPNLKFRYKLAKEQNESLQELFNELQESVGGISGVLIEDKRYSLSIHYRLVNPLEAAYVRKVVKESASNYPGLKLTKGKMVLELRPKVEWNKGDAVETIRESFSTKGLPIYVGDDKTDEDVFRKFSKGITVRVGRSEVSAARYYVNSHAQVYAMLGRILMILRRPR